jgi:putative ABC transport system substrate-binding protein
LAADLVSRQVAVLFGGGPPAARAAKAATASIRHLGLKLHAVSVAAEHDIDAAFASFADHRVDGVLVGTSPRLFSWHARLIALAARASLPAIYDARQFVADGGLISYGTSLTDAYRLAGIYASRILKGEKPADLPVQQSTKFELLINLRTAKALGLEIPDKLLALADEVIE